MKAFIVLALVAYTNAAVIYSGVKPIVQSGPVSGPLTPALGDLVQTPRGLRPASLEGFSEDVNQDGFVDPVAQAVPTPIVSYAAAPVVAAPAAPAISYAAAPVLAAAPAISYSAPVAQTVSIVRNIAPAPVSYIAGPRLAQNVLTGLPIASAALPIAAAPAKIEAAPIAVEQA